MDSSRPHPVTCPRCGYDQRGVIAAWTDTGPTEGTCTECGLTFEWRELLDPRMKLPRWCVEHRPPRVVVPRQIIATLVRSCWPLIVWRSVKMTHACRWRRLGVYIVVVMSLAYAGYAIGNGITAGVEYARMGNSFGGALNDSPWYIGAHAALYPFSRRSAGTWTFRGRTYPSTNPAYYAVDRRDKRLMTWAIIFGSYACTILAFAALPISRRRAKVQWRHIARVGVYGLAIPLAALAIDTPGIVERLAYFARLGLIPWAIAWWKTAATHYLRMEHGWPVSLSVVTLGTMIAMGAYAMLYTTFQIPWPD